MNTEINPETGLPTLPDDMFWRIEHDNRAGLRFYVELYRKVTRTVAEHRIPKSVEKRVWSWSRLREVTISVDTWETIPEKTETIHKFMVSEKLLESKTLDTLDELRAHRKDGWFGTDKRWDDDEKFFVTRPLKATPENFRKAAEKAWTTYITKEHEEALRMNERLSDKYLIDKYCGVYPPKKLEG